MDKCPKCGNKLSSIDVLCPRCGSLVEVVQIKRAQSIQSTSGTYDSPTKKPPQQNLVVYNDDLPSEDILQETGLEPEAKLAPVPDYNPLVQEPAPPTFDIPSLDLEPELHAEEDEVGTEADYLALLKNMNLPELEDINEADEVDDDLASAIRELTGSTDEPVIQPSFNEIAVPVSDAPHRWLEIEELAEAAATEAFPIRTQPDPPLAVAASLPEQRTLPPLPEQHPLPEQRRYHSDNAKRRKLASSRGAGRVVMMVFIWIFITCAVFCGFYFFDQYVVSHYGSYQTMLDDISGGQINFGSPRDTIPVSPEST